MFKETLNVASASVSGARESYLICDIPGLAEWADTVPEKKRQNDRKSWYGGMTYNQSLKAVREGDLSGVAVSDKYLDEIESMVPITAAWKGFNSVTGGCPIVPLYLAGEPMNMRSRRRVTLNTAPLSVFVDLTSSAAIDANDCRKRGAAILALVRCLTALRPVELWGIVAIGGSGKRASMCVRIDTAPLDLARAAHVLTHTSVFRGLGYRGLQNRLLGDYWLGGWPFENVDKHRKTARDFYRDILNPGSETLFVPPVFLHDEAITKPIQWIQKYLAEYGGIEPE